jgi:hypothetical protein
MQPTDNGKNKPRGFATFSPEKRLEAQRKGGTKTGPKGFALLSPEARRENASKAARIRWERVKAQRLNTEIGEQRQETQDTNEQEAH